MNNNKVKKPLSPNKKKRLSNTINLMNIKIIKENLLNILKKLFNW